MPRFDSVDQRVEPLANAAVALAAAYMLRYVGWLRSSTHHRNVLHRIEIANMRACTQVLKMQAAACGRAARASEVVYEGMPFR
eukprot:13969030-Alexandrium_andersonii.AAC.1